MGCAHDIDRQLDRFLKEHCPDPALIRSAITRAQLWAVAEYLPDEMICRRGDRVRACWLVLSGQIEIRADDQTVAFRGAGELVGEPGLLHFLAGKTGARTADIKACGPVRLLCIDASFQQNLNDQEKVVWIQTLADVVNLKLEQATQGRSELEVQRGERVLFDAVPPSPARNVAAAHRKSATGPSGTPLDRARSREVLRASVRSPLNRSRMT